MKITRIILRIFLLAVAAPALLGTVVNVQLQEGNTQAIITANDNAIWNAFHAYRTEEGTVFNFPPGKYYVSKSVSPSGWNAGAGARGAVGKTLNFRGTELVFTGYADDINASLYNQVQLHSSGNTWVALPKVIPNTAAPYDKTKVVMRYDGINVTVKPDLRDPDISGGPFRDHWVAFDIRNSPKVNITGFLSLTRDYTHYTTTPKMGNLPNDRLVAIASSGGDIAFDDVNVAGEKSSGMGGGSIDALRIQGFSIGFFAENQTGGTKTLNAFKNVTIRKLNIQNAWRCFVVGNLNFGGVSILQLSAVGGATSYFYNAGMVNISSCFLIDRLAEQVDLDGDGNVDTMADPNGPDADPPGKPRPAHKFLEIVDCKTTFGGIYSRPADNSTFSTVNVGNNGTVTIGTLHNDFIDSTTSGHIVTMVSDDAAHVSTSGTLRILASGYQLERSKNLNVTGISAVPSGQEERLIYVGAYHTAENITQSDPGFLPIDVIKDFRSLAIGGGVSGDRIWTHTTQGLLYRKVKAGPKDNTPPPPPAPPPPFVDNFVNYPTWW